MTVNDTRNRRLLVVAAALIALAVLAGTALLLLRGQKRGSEQTNTTSGAAPTNPFEQTSQPSHIMTALEARSLPVYDLALTWTPVEGAEGYYMYRRRIDILGAPERLASLDAQTHDFVDLNASCGASYQYLISAVVNHEEQFPSPDDSLQLTMAPCPASSLALLDAEAPALNLMTGQTGTHGVISLTTAPFAALSPALLDMSYVADVQPIDGAGAYALTDTDGSRIGQAGIWGNGNIGFQAIWGNGNIGIWGNGNIGIWENAVTAAEVYIVPASAIPQNSTTADMAEWTPDHTEWIPIPDDWIPHVDEWIPVAEQWVPHPDPQMPGLDNSVIQPEAWLPYQGTVELTANGMVLYPADSSNTVLASGGGFYLIPKDVLPHLPLQHMPAIQAAEAGGVLLMGNNPAGYLHTVTGDLGAFQDPLVGFQDPLVGFQDPLVGMMFPYAPAVRDTSYIAPAGDGMSFGVFTVHASAAGAQVEYFVYTPMDGALILTPYASLPDLQAGGVCSSNDGVCDPTCTSGVDTDCSMQTCISGDGVCSPACATSPDYQMTLAVGIGSTAAASAYTDLDCLSADAGSQTMSLPTISACNPHDGVCSPTCQPTSAAGMDWECAALCASDGVCSTVCQNPSSDGGSGASQSAVEALTAAYLQALLTYTEDPASDASAIPVSDSETSASMNCFDIPAHYVGASASAEQTLSTALLDPDSLCMLGSSGPTHLPGLPGMASSECETHEGEATVRVCMPAMPDGAEEIDTFCSSPSVMCIGYALGSIATEDEGESSGDDPECTGSLFACMKDLLGGTAPSASETEPDSESTSEPDSSSCGSLYACMKDLLTDAINEANQQGNTDAAEQPAQPVSNSPSSEGDSACQDVVDANERIACELLQGFEASLDASAAPRCGDIPTASGQLREMCLQQGSEATLFGSIVNGVLQTAIRPQTSDPDCRTTCVGDTDSCTCAPNTAFPLQGCFNPNGVTGAQPTPTASPGGTGAAGGTSDGGTSGGSTDVCSGHGGISWQGTTCVCPGLVDEVVLCMDGTKFDNVTDASCTPSESCNAGTSGGGGEGSGGASAVCGNGVLETGEACEQNSHCAAGMYCTSSCTCEIIN